MRPQRQLLPHLRSLLWSGAAKPSPALTQVSTASVGLDGNCNCNRNRNHEGSSRGVCSDSCIYGHDNSMCSRNANSSYDTDSAVHVTVAAPLPCSLSSCMLPTSAGHTSGHTQQAQRQPVASYSVHTSNGRFLTAAHSSSPSNLGCCTSSTQKLQLPHSAGASRSWQLQHSMRLHHSMRMQQMFTDGAGAGTASSLSMQRMCGCAVAASVTSVQHVRGYASAAGGRRSSEQDDDEDASDLVEGRRVVRASQVSSAAVQAVLSDPMAMLLSSRGMPLGISLKQGRNSAGSDTSEHINNSNSSDSSSSSSPHSDSSTSARSSSSSSSSTLPSDEEDKDAAATAASLLKRAPAEPGYDMEAIDDIFEVAKAGAAAGSAAALGSKNAADSWGTTRESPAEIARRIMEIAGDDGTADATAPVEEGENLHLSPDEQRYANLEAMTKDIKGLDEVWEVLASVPWLDDGDVAQKELKGVAMVGLLGTLEEVGFDIRTQLARVWAGERDDAIIVEGVEPRQQAALISIMFHTKQLEDMYGPPPAFIPLPK